MHIAGRDIGINFNPEGVANLKVWAPLSTKVSIKVIAGHTIELVSTEYGYWESQTDHIKPGDLYLVVLQNQEDELELPDPASLAQPHDVHGPSMAVDLHYEWEDQNWVNHALAEYIIYELHTGTFSNGGDFSGIIQHLPHLKELGITAIEIMPVASFAGERNWGYDGVFPFSVQSCYGGAKELQRFINSCHQNGIAVILDVVYNHLGPEGNYLPRFGPYFTDKYATPWGQAINFDDKGADGVRHFFIENAMMWLRDFHVDALRLDAVHAIKDFSATHILQEISRHAEILSAQTGRIHYLFAETDLNDPKYITEVSDNGMGMDAQWVDEFHHALRVTSGEKKTGYYADFSGIAHLAKSYTDAYVYTGMYSKERERSFGRDAGDHSGAQFVVFSQNHDQVGNRMLGERTSELVSFEMQKLLAASVLFSPFVPMLFMGEEWGETNPFQYFVSHSDPELIALVRKGRQQEFASMHTGGEAPDPQSAHTFMNSKLNWGRIRLPSHMILLQYYKQLIRLRKSHLALRMCDRKATVAHPFEEQQSLVLERGFSGSSELVVCFLNFSTQQQTLSLPQGIVINELLIDSTAIEFQKENIVPSPTRFHQHTITIHPESFIAYSATYV